MVFALAVAVCLVGCGSSGDSSNGSTPEASAEAEKASSDVLKNDSMTIEGVYIDESYAGSDADKDIKRLYVFADVTATSGTLSISSASFELTASYDDATDELDSIDVIQYDTDSGSDLANLATSYTCTNVISEVLPGSSQKIIIPFNVPTFYLKDGATFELSNSDGLADGLKFGYGTIQDKENLEAIAQSADSAGYEAALKAREDASPEVAQDVMNKLDGYEYYQSFGGLTQTYKFDGNRFTVRASGMENSGTYTVKNGYLACLQDSTGWVTWIPWEASDSQNGIDLEIDESFVEK